MGRSKGCGDSMSDKWPFVFSVLGSLVGLLLMAGIMGVVAAPGSFRGLAHEARAAAAGPAVDSPAMRLRLSHLPFVSPADLRASQSQLSTEGQALMTLINAHRQENGVPTLSISPSLTDAALWMSQDMAANDYVGHTDSSEQSLSERMADFGYDYNTWKGENLAAGTGSPQRTFELWRDSPRHNDNMLNSDFMVIGLARAYNPDSTHGWYWAADFGGYDDSNGSLPMLLPASMSSPTPTSSAVGEDQELPKVMGADSPQAQSGALHNCPHAGKWSVSVWNGPDGTDSGEVLATCGAGSVDMAYYIEPDTQEWQRYMVGHTDISNLSTVDNMQGIIAHGAVGVPRVMSTVVTQPKAGDGTLENCPRVGKWALSVWPGDDADTGRALATCGAGAIDFAYYIDPDTQEWRRYIVGDTDISNLSALGNMQGVIAHGAIGGLPHRSHSE